MIQLLFIIFLACFVSTPVFADDYVFPVPEGSIYVSNGYENSGTHKGDKAKFSLDFQYLELIRTDFERQCYTIGMPILAAKSGTVAAAKNPPKDKLNEKNYGVHVRIVHSDGTMAWYAHMLDSTLAVKMGDSIQKGQILGLAGATGYTYGRICKWKNGIGIQVNNEAPHLHFEINKTEVVDARNKYLAVSPEPLVGAENYTNIQTRKSYTSTTIMYDPTGHWTKYAGKVPYRLTYNPTRIESFSPLTIEGGKEQVFTIKGENLFESLKVALPGCWGGIKWLKRESNEQQFSCTLSKPSQKIIKPGYIKFGVEKIHFKIEVFPDDTIPSPIITRSEAFNPVAGKETDFVVEGSHLPGDLKLNGLECQEVTYKSLSTNKQEFSCKLPHTIYKSGKRINNMHTFSAELVSESANYSYPFSFSADYAVGVFDFLPAIAHAGEITKFTFTGKNLHLIQAAWIENCQDFREVSREDNRISFECIFPTEEEDSLMSLLVPNILKQNIYRILLKDESEGTNLFDSKVSVFYYRNVHASLQGQQDEKLYSEIAEGGGILDESEAGEVAGLNLPNINDNEAVSKYLIESNGKYDNAFLKKMGWENVGTTEKPVYKLINCKNALRDLGDSENNGQLNTAGECAQGLNNMFLED